MHEVAVAPSAAPLSNRVQPEFAIPAWELPFVPLADGRGRFPVRRIHCVGRNYAEHTREMGFDPTQEPPFFFAKPADAIVLSGSSIEYPPATRSFAHEVELVVAMGSGGMNIPREAALDHVFGYAVGIDLTRRDLQLAARERGRPWEPGKAFECSAAMGAIHPAQETGHLMEGEIWLTVNGEAHQRADLRQLLWPVPDIISFLSQLITIKPGDLIFTGTPAGVGPLLPGDQVDAGIRGLSAVSIHVVERHESHGLQTT